MSLCIKQEREIAYRIYVTDTLKLIAENTAKFTGGAYREDRYAEIYQKRKEIPKKTVEETIAEVTKKAGLVVIE